MLNCVVLKCDKHPVHHFDQCRKIVFLAERLDELKIPFVFVTGYGADVRLPPAFRNTPRLPKPYSSDALRALLKRQSGDGR